MKRQFFIAIIVLLATTMSVAAQGRYANPETGRPDYSPRKGVLGYSKDKMYYGIRFGLSFSQLQSSVSDGEKPYEGSYSGFRTGVCVNAIIGFKLVKGLNFETGLSYIGKGGVKKRAEGDFKYSLDYMELPLVFKYNFDLGRNFYIEPLFGGYLGLGLGGKWRDYEKRDVDSAFGDEKLRRPDAGLRFGCGVEYNVFYLELAYDLGLANISHDNFDATHNRNLLLSFGVNF